MRLHVVVLASVLLATGALAATITQKQDNFDKKLIQVVKEELSKDELPNQTSEHQLIDETNIIKDVQNNLRKGEINNIPVQIVVDNDAVKLENEVENDDNIKRVEIDLNNPGEPQRQEHETQNHENYTDQSQSLLALIRQNVMETQNIFNNGVQTFQSNLQNWWQSNQQVQQIQQNLQELQQNFQNSINKFNETVQSYYPTQGSDPLKPVLETQSKETVESGLTALKTDFEESVQSISADVKAISGGKQDESSSTTGSTGGFPGFGSGPFATYFQQLQTQIQAGFQNMTSTFQNYFNQSAGGSNGSSPGNLFQNWGQNVQNFINQQSSNQPAAQSDDAQTNRPTIWTGIQSIFNPQNGQNIQSDPVNQPQSNRPIVQAIQNNPIVQGFVGLINRPGNKPEDPKPSGDKPQANEGVNVLPEAVEKPEKKPELVPYAQSGPIKQMLIEKNPVAQGIVGVAQRIQEAMNPVKPRDQEAQNDQKQVVAENKGHKPGGGASDTSNINNRVEKDSEVKEEKKEESQPQKTD